MSDQFTETRVDSWGARIGSSMVAALFGLLLLPASVWGLAWNEGRAVTAAAALRHAAVSIIEVAPNAVDPRNDGRLVHLTGLMKPASPAGDPLFGVSGDGLLRLSREVETYQWQQKITKHSQQNLGGSQTTQTTYSYQPIWSARALNSASFRIPYGHENPPVTLQNADFTGGAITIGAYHVSPGIVAKIGAFTPLPADHATPPEGFRPEGDGFYSGQDPANPAVGDIRVKFKAVLAQTVSVAAAQWGDQLTEFRDASNYGIALAEPGVLTAADLLQDAQRSASQLTWAFRGGGFLGVLMAFLLMMQPLKALAAVLPVVETIVGTGAFAVALTLAIPITLVTIAIAWLSFRPLLGGGLLAAAVVSLLLRQIFRRRTVRAASPAPVPSFFVQR